MNRGAGQATVYGVSKNRSQLKQLSMHAEYIHIYIYHIGFIDLELLLFSIKMYNKDWPRDEISTY